MCRFIAEHHPQLHPKLQHREMTAWDNLGVLFLELLEIYGKHYK